MKTEALTRHWFPALLFVSVLALGASAWRSHEVSMRLTSEQESFEECIELASKINAARDVPETATDYQQPEEELARRIEGWAGRASVEAGKMTRIDPLTPRRLDDSDYLIQGAEIEFSQLRLPQIARFAAVVAADDSRFRISQLRVTPSRGGGVSGAGEPWHAEIALTYLLHSPKSIRRQR